MNFDWPYYDFRDGFLWDEEGVKAFDRTFDSANDAEQWLENEDMRGSVR